MEHVTFIASGFGIVLAVLAALWGICALVGLGFKPRRGHTTLKEDEERLTYDGVPPEHVAAISAVLAQIIDEPYRIISVSAPAHRTLAWEEEGRYEQAAGHRVRWDWHAAPENRPKPKRKR